jgi:hypothetical protein
MFSRIPQYSSIKGFFNESALFLLYPSIPKGRFDPSEPHRGGSDVPIFSGGWLRHGLALDALGQSAQ